MNLSTRILGKGCAERITARASAPLLVIGRDVFYRRDLAVIGCFNFLAAANLSTCLAGFRVRDTRDLFDHVPPSALVIPKLGSVSLAVLGAAFEAKRIGGGQPLEAWVAKHRAPDARRDFVTFDTMKHAEAKREIGERRARRSRRARTHARRDQAQRLLGERFITRRERVTHVED